MARLCCAIELDLEGGETLSHLQQMTTADYAYDRAGVRELIRRVGAESSIPETVFEELEQCVDHLETDFHRILSCFQRARAMVV